MPPDFLHEVDICNAVCEKMLAAGVDLHFVRRSEISELHVALDSKSARLDVDVMSLDEGITAFDALCIIIVQDCDRTDWPRTFRWKELRRVLGDPWLLQLSRTLLQVGGLHWIAAFPATRLTREERRQWRLNVDFLVATLSPQPALVEITRNRRLGRRYWKNPETTELVGLGLPRFARLLEVAVLSLGKQPFSKEVLMLRRHVFSTKVSILGGSLRALDVLLKMVEPAIEVRHGAHSIELDFEPLSQASDDVKAAALSELDAITLRFANVPANVWLAHFATAKLR